MKSQSTDTAEQRALIAAAQAGDERAFRTLIEPYRVALEVHCYRMLGSLHDAEDVLQETLLRAWSRLERFERRASIHTWLYRIATNACLDELERRPRRAEPMQPFPDARIEAATEPLFDPAARYALREGMELALLTAIQQLPGRQRATLILRDVLGWSSPEVAELLDSTVAAVNSALQRARATIELELPPLPPASPAAGERDLLRRYVEAWEHDDVDALIALLHEDALLRMPPQEIVRGAGSVARFFRETAAGGELTRMLLTPTRANGRAAVAIHAERGGDRLIAHGILVLEIEAERIAAIDAFIDPALPALFGFPATAVRAHSP
jgi:RNA polymerase sigma-70 factor (ECF subfamily)